MKKSLSIIIPYYNAMPYTKELLDVLAPQITDEIEVIVVDDGSREPIHKSDYVNRLKADMVAMLDELDIELYEQYEDTDLVKVKYIRQSIQQKINKLKGEQGT